MIHLDDSCPCFSGRGFDACCGPYRGAAHPAGPAAAPLALASLRSILLAALREGQGMMEMWFAFLDELPQGLRERLEEKADRQILADHFLWDWFHRYSESRPLCRAARAVEATDIRGASRLDEWALAPWEPWEVLSGSRDAWTLHRIGGDRKATVLKAFAHHRFQVGDAILSRLLPHLGHNFLGLSVSVFRGEKGRRELHDGYDRIVRKFGLTSHVHLRPDIHNEAWRPLHAELLALALHVKAVPRPAAETSSGLLDTPRPDLGGATPRQSATHEFGRHRLRLWLRNLDGADRKAVEDLLG
jgi:hypothetical protein